ncbi:uncharacterized protein A4U43_C08F1090 [Asparagus officinalis]|nr:uncharacterized protein A4U43_C08F1090 [Asparagus officinalis]
MLVLSRTKLWCLRSPAPRSTDESDFKACSISPLGTVSDMVGTSSAVAGLLIYVSRQNADNRSSGDAESRIVEDSMRKSVKARVVYVTADNDDI